MAGRSGAAGGRYSDGVAERFSVAAVAITIAAEIARNNDGVDAPGPLMLHDPKFPFFMLFYFE